QRLPHRPAARGDRPGRRRRDRPQGRRHGRRGARRRGARGRPRRRRAAAGAAPAARAGLSMAIELPELLVPDAVAWRAWLAEHHETSIGVWLVLHKKGGTVTALTYVEA